MRRVCTGALAHYGQTVMRRPASTLSNSMSTVMGWSRLGWPLRRAVHQWTGQLKLTTFESMVAGTVRLNIR